MQKAKLIFAAALSIALIQAQAGFAQSLVDGNYLSDGAENGTGKCTLSIARIESNHKYGDDAFGLESTGEGACEWTAIGVSKNYVITAGLVTSGGTPAFVKLTFPFGPAGKRLELIAFDVDGSIRNREVFSKI
ncbi:MAG: hypothetical protein WDZ52_12120 [Pseudohongiellaceae bacterium]